MRSINFSPLPQPNIYIVLKRSRCMGKINNCNKCGVELVPCDNWSKSRVEGRNLICKSCHNERNTRWSAENRERANELSRECKYRKGVKPMNENKTCSQYLGVNVAEKVLSKTFKDVEVMPRNNPGYDFICNKGKKIDVKSSCVNKQNIWQFNIRNNAVADYFLCIAFDNRDDVNPLHVWLIACDIVHDCKTVSISERNISKWDSYKLDIKNVVECCDKIKMGLTSSHS